MSSLRITSVPQASSVADSDDLYIKTGDNFRRVPVSSLLELLSTTNPALIIYVPVTKNGSSYTVNMSSVDLRGYESIVNAWSAGADIRMYFWDGYDLYIHPLIGFISNYSDLVFGGPEFDSFTNTVETAVYHITQGGDVYRYVPSIPSAQGVSF